MTTPVYLLDKLARHGAAAERLRSELREGAEGVHDGVSAVAFDAANFVWSFLVLSGHEEAQESRVIRNAVAEAIVETLRGRGVNPERLNVDRSEL